MTLHELPDAARDALRAAAEQRRTDVTLTLRPPELGEVRIRVGYGDGTVTTSITTTHHDAAQALAQAAPDLRRALEAAGLAVGDLDVQHRDQGDEQQQRQDAAPQQRRPREAAPDDLHTLSRHDEAPEDGVDVLA